MSLDREIMDQVKPAIEALLYDGVHSTSIVPPGTPMHLVCLATISACVEALLEADVDTATLCTHIYAALSLATEAIELVAAKCTSTSG